MFIPLHDANELNHIRLQYVTIALIGVNCLIWLLGSVQSPDASFATALGWGYIPAVAHDVGQLSPDLYRVPSDFTYFTYSFLHGDFWHLAGNMLFLWVFGDNVEDALGHVKFLVFFFACAAAGAFLHGQLDPLSRSPLIGASGGVAGIVAAYLILHPKVKVWVLVLARVPMRIPAWIPLVLWVGYQFYMVFDQGFSDISWGAHIGGIVAGACLVIPLRRRGVPLLDREIIAPQSFGRQQETHTD